MFKIFNLNFTWKTIGCSPSPTLEDRLHEVQRPQTFPDTIAYILEQAQNLSIQQVVGTNTCLLRKTPFSTNEDVKVQKVCSNQSQTDNWMPGSHLMSDSRSITVLGFS